MASKPDSELSELTAQYGRYVTYPQAAEITTASVRTLKRETAAGRLPCYQVGSARALRLKLADVLALVQRVA